MTVTPLRYPPAVVERDRVSNVVELLPTYIELAGRIANTEFVPSALRRRPEAVLAALMSGAERGLGPMESLRSVHVIEGRPSLSAEAMRALVLAAGHEIEIVESTPMRATVVGRRAGSDSTSPSFTWTMDRARRARLAGKDNWVKYPEAMLLARASTDLCRAVFPDVIAGLASFEEVVDEIAPEQATTTTRRSPARRTAPTPVASTPEIGAADEASSRLDAPAAPIDAASTELVSTELEEIPGSDATPWAPTSPRRPPPEPAATDPRPHDEQLARRIHVEIANAFPNIDSDTRDRWRHSLCAVVTRKRPDGPATSSSDLDREEQLALSDLLVKIKGGSVTVAAGPDETTEIRAGGGWRYTVALNPLVVTVAQGAGDDSPPPPTDQEAP